MSTKLKTGLLIGGVGLGSIVACLIVAFLVLSVVPFGRGATFSAAVEPQYFGAGGADDGGEFYAEEEAPAGEPMEDSAVAQSNRAAMSDVDVGQSPQVDRVIIRTGSIDMTVENTRDTKEQIESMVADMAGQGAFVVSSSESGGRTNNPYVEMNIRIPAERFDEVMNNLEEMAVEGTSPTVSENAQDVTEEYVDIQARIETLEAARQRLLELMETAETTEALLQAEQQLTQRESEIESLKGRLRYLTESARLSRISISLQPYVLSQPVDTRWRPAETFREALEDLVNGLRNFADFLINVTIGILPILLIIGLIIYGIIRLIMWFVRRRRRRNASSEGEQA